MTITIDMPEDTPAAAQVAAASALPPVPHVAEGDADFAAGRFKSFEAFCEGFEQRHGIKL